MITRYVKAKDAKRNTLGQAFKVGSTLCRWHEQPEAAFRFVGLAHDVARKNDRWRAIEHTGWYTEDDGNGELARGVVYQLSGGKGYIAGIADPDNADKHGYGPAILCLTETYSDDMEAALASDHIAEVYAENERDYRRAWQAGADAAYENEQAGTVRRRIMQLCADLRAARRLVPLGNAAIARLCDTARREVQSLLGDLAKHKRRRDKLRSDYGTEPAFLEGYSEA